MSIQNDYNIINLKLKTNKGFSIVNLTFRESYECIVSKFNLIDLSYSYYSYLSNIYIWIRKLYFIWKLNRVNEGHQKTNSNNIKMIAICRYMKLTWYKMRCCVMVYYSIFYLFVRCYYHTFTTIESMGSKRPTKGT
jgi:hypothetical protein